MENIYHEAIFQESSNIALNIDVIRLSNKLTELIAVNEERYSDACKWRDFPQHGIVRVDMKTFYII